MKRLAFILTVMMGCQMVFGQLKVVQAITVYASELPAGMYLYTLVVDNVIIDSKRMILTK